MPIKNNISQGVDLNELATKAAKQMLHNKKIVESQLKQIESESDTLYIMSELSIVGTTKWTVITGLPFDIEPFSVYVSIEDTARNKQSRRELLERRLRRGLRDRLLMKKILPESVAKHRVLRMQVVVN